MSLDELGHFLFLCLVGVFALGGITLIYWLLITIFVPKSLIQTYFREPHFTLNETIFLARYPGSLFRTVIFGWSLVLKPFGYTGFRKLDGARQAMPTWYAYSLYFLIYSSCICLILIFLLFAVLFGLDYYQGK